MSQKRSKVLQVNLEPTIYDLTQELAPKLDMRMSSYVRSLIVRDLRERGLLTDRMIADIATSAC